MLQITIFDKFPKDWDLVGLEDFVNSNSGIKPGPFGSSITKDCYTKVGYRVYGQEQVIAGDLSVGDYFISKQKLRQLRSFAVQVNDILLSLVGTVGKVLVVREPFHPGIINPRLIRLRPHDQINTQYLKHLLESSIVRYQLNQIAQGGTMEVLSATVLRQLRLPKPQLLEQQKIAEIIDAIDKAIALTDTHITKLKKAKAGLLHDLLTRGIDEHGEFRDYTRNPELFKRSLLGIIPKDWDVEPLHKHTLSSAFGPRFSSSLYADDGNVATLRTTDMDEEGNLDLSTMPLAHLNLGLFNLHILEVGDLLISRSGTCGITAVFPGFNIPVLPGAFLIRFRLKESVKAEFIRRYFNYELGRARVLNEAEGGVQKNLRGSTLLKLLIPIPPKQEQDAIIYRLRCYESRIITRKICLAKLKLLKKGLMSDLLTGRVRVKI